MNGWGWLVQDAVLVLAALVAVAPFLLAAAVGAGWWNPPASIEPPAVAWTAVVAVLGEDSADGRYLDPGRPWHLRAEPVPLLYIPGWPGVVGQVDGLRRDGLLLRCWGVVWDHTAAEAMFSGQVYPAVALAHDLAQITAVVAVDTPAWPGRVRFERA